MEHFPPSYSSHDLLLDPLMVTGKCTHDPKNRSPARTVEYNRLAYLFMNKSANLRWLSTKIIQTPFYISIGDLLVMTSKYEAYMVRYGWLPDDFRSQLVISCWCLMMTSTLRFACLLDAWKKWAKRFSQMEVYPPWNQHSTWKWAFPKGN